MKGWNMQVSTVSFFTLNRNAIQMYFVTGFFVTLETEPYESI